MAAKVKSSQAHRCAACMGNISPGVPHYFSSCTYDRYHVSCWEFLEDGSPAGETTVIQLPPQTKDMVFRVKVPMQRRRPRHQRQVRRKEHAV